MSHPQTRGLPRVLLVGLLSSRIYPTPLRWLPVSSFSEACVKTFLKTLYSTYDSAAPPESKDWDDRRLPIILAVDIGKFELSEELVPQLQERAERVHQLLLNNSPTELRAEYKALFEWIQERGVRITLVDPRPVNWILPSPGADYEVLHRVFLSGV